MRLPQNATLPKVRIYTGSCIWDGQTVGEYESFSLGKPRKAGDDSLGEGWF